MAEYWLVEDKDGKFRGVALTDAEEAEWYRKIYDRDNKEVAPHRVVHLVEAGTVEPEVAACLCDALLWLVGWTHSLPSSLKKLRKHQVSAAASLMYEYQREDAGVMLRANGIEVPE